jgi:predicted aconitase
VQYIATGESIVQFANKYHAAQVIEKYNGRSYPDEGFCLKVCPFSNQNKVLSLHRALDIMLDSY